MQAIAENIIKARDTADAVNVDYILSPFNDPGELPESSLSFYSSKFEKHTRHAGFVGTLLQAMHQL